MNVPILRPLNPTSDSSTLITLLLYEEIKETIYIYICVCVYINIYIYIYIKPGSVRPTTCHLSTQSWGVTQNVLNPP